MAFSFPLFSLLFFACGIICLGLAVVVWNRRPAPGVVPMALHLVVVSVWTLASAFEAGGPDLFTRIISIKISYLGVVSAGVLWLFFALDYFDSDWWKRPRNIILLSIIPAVTLILAWTNELHGWQWSHIYLTDGPLGVTSVWEHGPRYMVNPVYQYLAYLAGVVIFIQYGVRRPGIYRGQMVLLLIGTAVTVIGSFLYVIGVDFAAGFDLTPFYLSVTAIVYVITIFFYRFGDVLPVAYRALVENNPDGILVLDMKGHILEVNPAAERILGRDKKSIHGTAIEKVWPELYRNVSGPAAEKHFELSTGRQVHLSTSTVPLFDRRHRETGKLVVLRDISELKSAHQKLEDLYPQERQLRGSLEEEIKKRDQYSRAIVHELKTPLTALFLSSELLEEQVKEPVQKSLVGNIRRSITNLFDPYRRRAKDGQGTSGLGLGLALCKFFVELHKGEIRAESTPGAGTTISFTVPFNAQHPEYS